MSSGVASFDLTKVINGMIPSKELVKFLSDNRGAFVDFGKKNSHILREKLHNLMEKADLDKDARFMLHFFASLMKRKGRMLDGLTKLEDTIGEEPWFDPLNTFINDYLVDFPDEETHNNFALIHLPATNPPMMMMCWVLANLKENLTFDSFLEQQVSAQLHLNKEVQALQKEKMRFFWEKVVVRTTRRERVKDFQKAKDQGRSFDEQIYANQEADKYILINHNFKAVNPSNMDEGYSKEDIENYIRSFGTLHPKKIETKDKSKKTEKKDEKGGNKKDERKEEKKDESSDEEDKDDK